WPPAAPGRAAAPICLSFSPSPRFGQIGGQKTGGDSHPGDESFDAQAIKWCMGLPVSPESVGRPARGSVYAMLVLHFREGSHSPILLFVPTIFLIATPSSI